LGTVVNSDQKESIAAIRITDRNESVVVRQGDKVHGEAKVYRIERRRVVIINGSKTETLTLDDEVSLATSATSRQIRSSLPRRPEPRSSRRRSARRSPKPDIENLRQNPAAILGMADLRPEFDEAGDISGIRISSIQEGSLVDQMGLEEGDVIKELNGITINDPRQSISLMREIQKATKFKVVVEKPDGTTHTLEK
jgi:general secretion pathway protein C